MTEETKVAAAEVASENSAPEVKLETKAKKTVAKKKETTTEIKPVKTETVEKTERKVAPKVIKASDRKDEKLAKKPSKKVKYSNPFSYEDDTQSKFVSCIMKNGKKNVAQKILKEAFDEMNRRGSEEPLKTFELAIKNATPNMEVRAKRIGGAVYQIPIPVTEKRQASLSVRWILEGARKKKGIPMYKRLVAELMDCAKETGYAFTKREDSHKMAQANRAFAHLARY